jgi:hypothetical protein
VVEPSVQVDADSKDLQSAAEQRKDRGVEDSFGHVEAEGDTSPEELHIESPGIQVLVVDQPVGIEDPGEGSSTGIAVVAETEGDKGVAGEELA